MSLATRDQFHFEQWELKFLKTFWGKGKLALCLIGKCSSGSMFLLGCVTLYVHVYGPESLQSLYMVQKRWLVKS